ncbi:methylamine utilization protein [Litoribrevibacter euphylliae]|uniref:methylamine utilization protein n=1 Tax=Litoribrevibacter euphylliae TaxID=1834034 RepID=UPI0036D98AD6
MSIIDQHGNPLANAVIEIQTKQAFRSINDTPYIMDQVNKTFVPVVLIIPKHSSIEFPNSDNIRHHVYSFSNAKPFELRLYSGKPEAPLEFNNEGIVILGCNIHDSMVGYIYVANSSYTFQSNSQGVIELDTLPKDITAVFVWHPHLNQGSHRRLELSLSQLRSDQPVKLNITPPAPRNTFEAKFKRISP